MPRLSSPSCWPRSRWARVATTTTTTAGEPEATPPPTEQKILGEIYAQGLEAAGYDVSKELNLGDEKVALKALKEGEIDAYPEYTGTALVSLFGVPSDDIPRDPNEAYVETRENFEKEGFAAQPPTPFTNSNEVGLTQEKADELEVTKISDLGEFDQDLTLYGTPECRQRRDCLLGLQEVYGLDFKNFVPVDPALRHEVLTSGKADLSIVFTTDPQIEREGEVLLEDDKQMFPPYNVTFVMQPDLADAGATEVVEQVQEGLTAEVMQELNARVDLDKKTPEEVATEYLQESGLL
jgi:osmoprotectant transport system substrate-binding protein